MQITRITRKNEEYFRPFLADVSDYERPNLLRLGAVTDKEEVAGAVSAIVDEDMLEIESVYVGESARRKGYGRALITALFDLSEKTQGTYRAVAANFPENTAVRAFFEDLGFDIFDGMSLIRMRFGEIMRLDRCRKLLIRNDTKGIRSIASLDESETRLLNNFFADKSIPSRGYFDPEWSTVCMNQNTIGSVMLIMPAADKVEILWFGMDSRDVTEPLKHMTSYLKKVENSPLYGGTTSVVFPDDNEKVIEAITNLSDGRLHVERYKKFFRAIKLT